MYEGAHPLFVVLRSFLLTMRFEKVIITAIDIKIDIMIITIAIIALAITSYSYYCSYFWYYYIF